MNFSMRPAFRILLVFAAGVVTLTFALALCQMWLLEFFDKYSWHYRPGEKHDYLPPGEGRVLLVIEFASIAVALWIVLRCLRARWTISRTAALSVAAPTALVGVMLFENLISPAISNPMMLSGYSTWWCILLAAIVGSLGDGKPRRTGL
ncbi:hypothetical protein [Paludibaculum fermentans]|uniref:hypothetical protein n=1 Tax=Paludibaculum fermentans TaxID=1473598 RepID=UPI003EB740D0